LSKIAEKDVPHSPGEILPGGKAALVSARDDIAVLSLESGEERLLVQGGAAPRYAGSGHLVFVRQGSLWAAPFGLNRSSLPGHRGCCSKDRMSMSLACRMMSHPTGGGSCCFGPLSKRLRSLSSMSC